MTFKISTICGLINKLIGPESSDVKKKKKKKTGKKKKKKEQKRKRLLRRSVGRRKATCTLYRFSALVLPILIFKLILLKYLVLNLSQDVVIFIALIANISFQQARRSRKLNCVKSIGRSSVAIKSHNST